MGMLREHLMTELRRRVDLAQMPHMGLGILVDDMRRAIAAIAEADDEIRALKAQLTELEQSWRETLRIERDCRLNETRLKEYFKQELQAARRLQLPVPITDSEGSRNAHEGLSGR